MQYRRPEKSLTGLALLLAASLMLAACGAEAPAEPAVTPTNEVAQSAPTATNLPATVAPTHTSAPASTTAPEQPTDTPLPAPTEAPLPADTPPPPTDTAIPPTDTPEPEPAVASAFGQTEDGLYFRGNPAAAVTVIDYSDFL
ncbi:MAG: hypothetical protein R2844_19950 [Caldilineales bacterium]